LFNAARFNAVAYNAASKIITPAPTVTVQGSLHYSTQRDQLEDETIDVNRVVFTALQPIDEFNEVGENVMFIGTFNGVRFSFSQRKSFYQQAQLNHYWGDAVYPALASQIIDNVAALNSDLIVSNSLPIWLMLTQFMPMYPSFLVPQDIYPPYASVHIDQTEAIGAAPLLDSTMTHTQLAWDRAKITMYGMNNQQALDFQDYVFQYISNNENAIGLRNMPVIRDEKRTQTELGVIAMKKTFDIEVNYYQTRINNLARQFIQSAIPTFIVSPDPH
jgi:hypothetical protein